MEIPWLITMDPDHSVIKKTPIIKSWILEVKFPTYITPIYNLETV